MAENNVKAHPPDSPQRISPRASGSENSQIPIFSRNLEVDSSPVRQSRIGKRPEEIVSPMKPEDRSLYFKVEAGKVLEIIRRKLSGTDRGKVSIDLIGDIYRSWHTLWEGDDKYPVGPFTEMFDIAYSILCLMSRLSRKLDEKESSLLISLVRAMSELVEGKAGVGYLDSCRLLLEKARRLGSSLQLECGVEEQTSAVDVSRSPVEPSRGKIPGGESGNDISSAVDKWFEQVTNLMVEPEAEKKTLQSPLSRAAGAAPAGREEPIGAAGEQDSGSQAGSAGDENPPAESIRSGAESSAAREPLYQPVEPRRSAPEPAGRPRMPSALEESTSSLKAGDLEPAVVPEVVSAYFRECCARSAVVISRYLKRLESSSPKRVSRVLSECLDELFHLAKNLEMEVLVDDLSAMSQALGELSRAPKTELQREKAGVRQGLSRLVAELEQQVISTP